MASLNPEERERILYEWEGVFIHTTVSKADDDALVGGKVFMKEKAQGVYVEWLQTVTEEPHKDTGWTVVDTVGYKSGPDNSSEKVNMMKAKKPSNQTSHKFVVNFDIKDLKSVKRSRPSLGWSYLIFILKCGTTFPPLHFHKGGTKILIRELEKYLVIKKSATDSCLYLVREQDPKALTTSFDELKLFEHQASDMVSKFFKDPYTTTLSGFSKVSGFVKDTLLTPVDTERPAQDFAHYADLMSDDFAGIGLSLTQNTSEAGFEMVETLAEKLPPLPEVKRDGPISAQRWSHHMDKDGVVQDKDQLLQAIFKGGVDPGIRIEVWKFLLGYYDWSSTYHSRTETRRKKVDSYFAMKLQWKSISEEQERRFAMYRERKNLIEKDVTRTDRTHPFFAGDENPNIYVLYDILMTYCMYNFDLGYVQGMSDLLSPILVVLENEVDAFWCFAGFMELVCHNFEMDQAGMKKQLAETHTLVKFLDPELCNYLESHESSNMFFCFRWLLIIFKREFSFIDIMRLWEVYWTAQPCKNFQLLIGLAILHTAKTTLIENNFGFTEILKHINDLSGTIDVEDTLRKAEAFYLQLKESKQLPGEVKEIVGFGGSPLEDAVETTTPSGSPRLLTPAGSTPGTPERERVNGNFSSGDDNSIEIHPEHKELNL